MLPITLSATVKDLAPRTGFEPVVGALTVRCLTAWLSRNKRKGPKPSLIQGRPFHLLSLWKFTFLALNHTYPALPGVGRSLDLA